MRSWTRRTSGRLTSCRDRALHRADAGHLSGAAYGSYSLPLHSLHPAQPYPHRYVPSMHRRRSQSERIWSGTLTGKKIRVDKQTGQPRAASEAEARATVQQLTALLEHPAGPPAVSYRSNGMQVARVDGYLNRVVVGRPLPDGRFETRCVSTLDEAVAFLGGDLAALEDR